jgi:L-asparaginase
MERYGAGFQLKAAHVISGYDSTVEAMVTKMMYLQGRYADNKKVREKLTESLAGEISI